MGNAAPRAVPANASQLDTASQCRTLLMEYKFPSSNMNLVFSNLLGDGKFLKTVQCKCEEGVVVVKLYRRYDTSESLEAARVQLAQLQAAFGVMEATPNIVPYAHFQLSTKVNAAFLVRQYFVANLYDRICTRPFLCDIEKKWITFQLLKALEQCHSRGICHGDIKQENVMVTSWNWIFLTDFAPFKPTYMPEDDPAEYYYYFCASDASRRSCSVAPERFYGSHRDVLSRLADSDISVEEFDKHVNMARATPSSMPSTPSSTATPKGTLHESMDIFATGCVIAELFNGGKPLFDLPTLLRYRTGDMTALATIRKLQETDPALAEMLRHMLQRDPRQRSSAAAYRLQYTQSIFPAYFDAFLFRFMSLVLSRGGKLPDARIRLVCKYYGRIVRELVGVDDKEGEAFFTHRLKEGYGSDRSHFTDDVAQRMYSEMEHPVDGPPPTDESEHVAETLLLTQAKFSVYAKRKHETLKRMKKASIKPSPPIREEEASVSGVDDGDVLPASDVSTRPPHLPSHQNGIMIILSLLCSSVRHCGVPQSKLTALQLITRLGAFADDEVRLQRLVPFVMEVLDDACAAVRAEAIRCVTSLLSLVKIFPLSDAAIFPQYILPALQSFPSDAEEMVRIAFAECLPSLAESARRFLEISCTLKMRALHANSANATSLESTRQTKSKTKDGKNGDATFSTFDDELNRLHLLVSRFVIQIAAPDQKASSSLVKRALLHDITRLCIFFGRERTLDVVLPQLITFLNDRDWQLRATFFEFITGVCSFVGHVSVELYILPCIEQALIDIQELVIARALLCLANLCALDMFQRTALLEKAKLTAPLLLHPGWWVRSAILKLLAAIAKEMDVVDRNVFLVPRLHPYLRKKVRLCKDDDVALVLRDALRPHVSREAFDAALMARNGPRLLLHDAAADDTDDETSMSKAESGDESFHLESSITPARRIKFNSEDSLDGYNPHGTNDLKKSTSAQAIARYERYYIGSSATDEGVRLGLMHQYIAMASMHMRSKIQLTHSEQSARYNGSDAPFVPFTRKIPKSSLHSLRVPSMKVALTVPLPLKPFSAVLKQSSKKDREAGLIKWESMPLAHIIRLYGLQTGSLATDAYQSVYDESATRTKVLQHDHVHDPALFHSHKLLARLTALDIPPLPLDMGPLRTNEGAVYSHAMTNAAPLSLPVNALPSSAPPTPSSTPSLPPTPSSALGTPASAMIGPIVPSAASTAAEMFRNWRPRESVLAAELTEHTGPVHRLGVAQDSSFLASASSDGTVKLWSVRSLAHSINQGSRGTYDAQGGVLTDMVVCENSHSLATSSSNGTVHVVRVERMSSTGALQTVPLRDMHVPHDAVVVLDYMNNMTESLLVYGTRSGAIYGWDLRFRRQAWKLQVSVELGHMTCMTHSSDATWLAVGTSRGYICLWDLRYHLLIRVWRHSSFHAIQRLEPCYIVASRPDSARNSPLVYVAAGDSEVAVFDLSIGACRGVFRTLHTQVQLSEADACPTLHHVQVPSRAKDVLASVLGPQNFTQALDEIATTTSTEEPTVRAIVTPSEYSLLTAGEDRRIRFWDLRNPKKSLTVCGGDASSFYDSQDAPHGWWKLKGDDKVTKAELVWSKMDPPTIHLCQDASSYFGDSTADGVAPNPALERRGPIPPSPAHNDCILDLKLVDVNGPMVVSSARDGVVKVWR
ncbi:VPS15 protein kinase [Saprolegnia diclina VS20]|uniref:non-specific serine/threonine protein kinase n=1 Tax=Saprolegnia diclina (strain VS20) TaxID=1156394 RepID=T0R693_SAPDV|nr:VPS15 protein kinase [Saprolegnia diclina VS20]EQC25017.1 VPS15 protein kinase [Saprolegnia diclina VS20]|eukprot:XP_008621551.1 VPS15 protein kinase [Saprolegnia diclina VS20]